MGSDFTGLWCVTAGVVTAGVKLVTTTPDVGGLTVSLCKSVLTSVSGSGEVVGSGVLGVENVMERTGVAMEAIVVVICVDLSRGGVE